MLVRAHRRRKVLWDAELRREIRRPLPCQVIDVSAGGAKIRCGPHIPAGAMVHLVVGRHGLDLPGTVLWRHGEHAGIRFLEDPQSVQARLDAAMSASLERSA